MSYPQGFRAPSSFDSGMVCESCGRIVDGIGVSVEKLADWHRSQCDYGVTKEPDRKPS